MRNDSLNAFEMKMCRVQRFSLRWRTDINYPPLQSENNSFLSLCLVVISLLSLEQFSNSIPSLQFKSALIEGRVLRAVGTEGRT